MIVYEVNLTVKHEIADEFARWLPGHIREMLQLEGFEAAEWLEDVDYDEDEGADPRWTIHYRLRSHDDLVRYVEQDAERMRASGLAHFGDRFQASRRVLRSKAAVER